MSKPQVLIVDDEPDLLELVCLTLNRMQVETQTARDIAGAKRLLDSESFDLCLTDMRLPDGNGLDLVAWIQENHAAVPVPRMSRKIRNTRTPTNTPCLIAKMPSAANSINMQDTSTRITPPV